MAWGATALTVMPYSANWRASERVKVLTAPLDVHMHSWRDVADFSRYGRHIDDFPVAFGHQIGQKRLAHIEVR
jgi:hypothetical protein